jgi:hypothetical protein
VTAGQVVVLVSLLCRVYSAPEPVMQCMVAAESDYQVGAVNGPCVGLAQWHPETLEWLGGLAARDPLWLHGYLPVDATDPVYSLALMAYWVAHGRGSEWSTWEGCQ